MILTRIGFVCLALTFFASCAVKPKQENLANYINRDILSIAQIELEAFQRYAAVTDKNYTTDQAVYDALKDELDALRERAMSIERKIGHLEGSRKQLTSAIERIDEVKEKKKEAGARLKEVASLSEAYHLLAFRVFHKKGVPLFAIQQLLPELSIISSGNLSDLTDGRFSRIQLVPYEESNRYGIRIEVEGPDKEWHDVAEFSGGERTQINAALRFAIAEELASLPSRGTSYGRMRTLFIDEGDLGSLDTEISRQLFVHKLVALSSSFEKVILITHLADVAEQFDNHISIKMTASQQSIVEK